MTADSLPPINAFLNGTSAVLLILAIIFVKRRSYRIHASLTISAFITSSLFLSLYLYHKYLLEHSTGHLTTTSTLHLDPTWIRPVYLYLLLLPHTILAVVMLPMILTTFYFAWKRRWASHRRLAPATFAVWLYVSVTGVGIYFLLYHLFPHFQSGG